MRGLLASALSLLLAATTMAQTPGVAGVNDYWITPGGTPGGVSCRTVTLVTPLVMNLNVLGAPNTPYVTCWFTCPCVSCWSPPAMGTSSCLTPPTLACPSSNQFLEVGVIAPCSFVFSIGGTSSTAGFATIPIPVPPATSPFTLSTQAVFLGPPACVVAPWFLLFSQAWNVSFV